jgi:3-hydroxyisobutyrate dehydrogenase
MNVAFLGTGLMGLPMAKRLLEAGISVVAYNRTAEKLAPLQQAGAQITTTPEIALQQSECIILMLTNAKAIQSVLFSESCRQFLTGRTIIQMGTIGPAQSRSIASQVEAAGGQYLEAPVLGSIPEATAGNLIVMVGASLAQFEQWFDLLKNFGPEPKLIGPVGSAAAIKLALNQLIASLTNAFALSLGFVQQQGADVETFMEILRQSALYAPTFDKKLQRMLERNYADPNFPTKHLMKDVNLFLAEAVSIHLNSWNLEGVQKTLEQAIDQGLADQDYSALFEAVHPKSE